MYIALMVLHILVAFIMVGVILLQAGKGAEIGAAFGGSSQTVFGSRGAGTFLSKMTSIAAIVFMVTSLSLAYLAKQMNTSSTIGLDKPGAAVPAAPPGVPTPTQTMTDQPKPTDSNAPAQSSSTPQPAAVPSPTPVKDQHSGHDTTAPTPTASAPTKP